jgi:hypothetical protein
MNGIRDTFPGYARPIFVPRWNTSRNLSVLWGTMTSAVLREADTLLVTTVRVESFLTG